MWNTIKRIFGYTIGFIFINMAIPTPLSFKQWCLITIGGCIIIVSTILCSNSK